MGKMIKYCREKQARPGLHPSRTPNFGSSAFACRCRPFSPSGLATSKTQLPKFTPHPGEFFPTETCSLPNAQRFLSPLSAFVPVRHPREGARIRLAAGLKKHRHHCSPTPCRALAPPSGSSDNRFTTLYTTTRKIQGLFLERLSSDRGSSLG
jgi:hypothetical protein